MGRPTKTPGRIVVLYIILMLLTGTLNTLCTKIQFTITSVGMDGKPELFSKPWFATFNMLAAMGVVGICSAIYNSVARVTSKQVPLLVDDAPMRKRSFNVSVGPSERKKVLMVIYPAVFDLVATALSAIGMLYIPASVWQMLRGSCLVFAAFLSISFLKRKMRSYNWIGLALCVVGVMLVGLANLWGQSEGSDKKEMDARGLAIGMSLVLLGQVVQAGQVVAEEFLMKEVDLGAMSVVGLEGFWGVLMMLVLVYPILYVLPGKDFGHQEDLYDTFVMLGNSGQLVLVVLLYQFSCATFNATGIAVTAELSAVHRMMLDASRTVLIWAFGLWVHYYVDPACLYGETWNSWSWMQLVGFAILVSGQAVYAEVLKLPYVDYPKGLLPSPMTPGEALALASPLPRKN